MDASIHRCAGKPGHHRATRAQQPPRRHQKAAPLKLAEDTTRREIATLAAHGANPSSICSRTIRSLVPAASDGVLGPAVAATSPSSGCCQAARAQNHIARDAVAERWRCSAAEAQFLSGSAPPGSNLRVAEPHHPQRLSSWGAKTRLGSNGSQKTMVASLVAAEAVARVQR